jgi:hypothetical protein
MEHTRRPPSLNLSSSSLARPVSSSPLSLHRQSQSPFRYIQLPQDTDHMDEKATPLIDIPSDRQQQKIPVSSATEQSQQQQQQRSLSTSSSRTDRHYQSRSQRPSRVVLSLPSASPLLRQPTPLSRTRPQTSSSYTRPRGLRIANLIKPWIPIILYGLSSLCFVIAIALFKTEVFARQFISQVLSCYPALNFCHQDLTNCHAGYRAMSNLVMPLSSFSSLSQHFVRRLPFLLHNN